MRVPKPIRLAAVAATALLLVAAGCGGGDDDDATPEPTTSSPRPDVDAAGDFQLVGTVEQAFVGTTPDIDIPSVNEDDDESLGSSATATPQATASGDFVTPPVTGIMRIALDDASAELRERCSADRDEDIEVFWTTSTEFARRLLGTDIEETLDRRLVGVIGSLFVGPRPDEDDDDGLGLGGSSTGSPAATGATAAADAATAEDRGCVLIADQVATSTGAIPTARPRTTARPTSTPSATRSPTPPPTTTRPPTTPPTTAPPTTAPPTTAPPP